MFKYKRAYLIPIIGFALIILISSLILYIPVFNRGNISFKDIVYTATSGITTTGLTKGAIVEQFTFWGQLILVLLMEIGALGFMIFISYFWSIRNKKIKMMDIIAIDASISDENLGLIKEHSIFIGKFMLTVQTIGIILLSIIFIPSYGLFKGIWYGIFHTVSAFSNTGFDLFGANSLTSFSNNVLVQLVIIFLMLIGSIGIFVIEDIKENKSKKFYRLKLQSRIIIITNLILIFSGMIIFKLLEPEMNLLNSLFTSISSRNTGIAISAVNDFCIDSKLLLITFMLIGGSPTSTGGGIKITTVVVVFSSLISTLQGKKDTVIMNRKINESIIQKAFTIFSLFILILTIASVVFYHVNNIDMINIVFECSSAISNTGFSISDSGTINIWGDFILMFLMFAGRVGPLSLVLIFVNEERKDKYIEYPSENIVL